MTSRIGPRIALALLGACCAAGAFGVESAQALFKELATPGTSGERMDAIVEELSLRPFEEVGPQAVHLLVGFRGFAIYNPSTDQPWLEERCSESEKIRYAVGAIWRNVIERAEPGSLSEPLVKLSLEARPEPERLMYLDQLRYRHYDDRAREPLERLAHDRAQPPEIAAKAAEILVQRVEANIYLPALMAACDRIQEPLTRSERFNTATVELSEKLSVENTRLFLEYAFALLGQIDDGKSGRGYFLALDLGRFLGIKPSHDGQGPFAPDQRLLQYQGEPGLKEIFFQETVDRARAWWRENQGRYTETAPSPPEKTP